MLKKLIVVFALLLSGSAFAVGPEMVIINGSEQGAEILYDGYGTAPPPLTIVRGVVVGHYAEHGGLDCAKTVHRPICETLQFVNDIDPCKGSPDFIFINAGGHGAHIYCVGNAEAPPPIVWVNGEVVAGG